jgi:hypothetical protein
MKRHSNNQTFSEEVQSYCPSTQNVSYGSEAHGTQTETHLSNQKV